MSHTSELRSYGLLFKINIHALPQPQTLCPQVSPESTQNAPFRPATISNGMCLARLFRTLCVGERTGVVVGIWAVHSGIVIALQGCILCTLVVQPFVEVLSNSILKNLATPKTRRPCARTEKQMIRCQLLWC